MILEVRITLDIPYGDPDLSGEIDVGEVIDSLVRESTKEELIKKLKNAVTEARLRDLPAW